MATIPNAAMCVTGRAGRDLRPDALRLMEIQLQQLLDRYPPARQGLRALALIEQILRSNGAMMFEDVELSVLGLALRQLERLVVDWSPRGLADLRSRMAIAVAERDGALPVLRDVPVIYSFWVENRLSVNDASLSVFDEAQRKWAESPQEPPRR